MISPISEAIVKPVIHPIPGRGHQHRDIAMIDTSTPQPSLDLADSSLELVNQLQARLDVTAPWLGEIQLGKQPPASDPEQVSHRDLMAEHGSTTNAPGS